MAVIKVTVTVFFLFFCTHLGSSFGANDHKHPSCCVLGELVTLNASLYCIHSTNMCRVPTRVLCGARAEGVTLKGMFC